MHCQNRGCMLPTQECRKFLDPRRGKDEDLAYVVRFICSPKCEEEIVDELERQAQYARIVH